MEWHQLKNDRGEATSSFETENGWTVKLDPASGEWQVFDPDRPDESCASCSTREKAQAAAESLRQIKAAKGEPMTEAEMQAERDARRDEEAKNLGFTKWPGDFWEYRGFTISPRERTGYFLIDDDDSDTHFGCDVDTLHEAKRIIDESLSD